MWAGLTEVFAEWIISQSGDLIIQFQVKLNLATLGGIFLTSWDCKAEEHTVKSESRWGALHGKSGKLGSQMRRGQAQACAIGCHCACLHTFKWKCRFLVFSRYTALWVYARVCRCVVMLMREAGLLLVLNPGFCFSLSQQQQFSWNSWSVVFFGVF